MRTWYKRWAYKNAWVEEKFDDGALLWFDARYGCFYYEHPISKKRVEIFPYYPSGEIIGHFRLDDFNSLEWHSKDWDGREDLTAKKMTAEEKKDLEKKIVFYADKWSTRFIVDRACNGDKS